MYVELDGVSDDIFSRIENVIASAGEIDGSGLDAKVRIVLSNGLLVFLAAVIEESIRETLKSYLNVLEQKVLSPDRLPVELIQENYRSIGERIKVLSRAKSVDAQKELLEVFEGVNEAHKSGGMVPFDSRRLTNNQSNMTTKQVTDIFKRVGIHRIWYKLSLMQEIIDYFPASQQKQIEHSLTEKWNEVFKERDQIMHNNSNSNGVGAPAISNYAEFFKVCLKCEFEILNKTAEEILA